MATSSTSAGCKQKLRPAASACLTFSMQTTQPFQVIQLMDFNVIWTAKLKRIKVLDFW